MENEFLTNQFNLRIVNNSVSSAKVSVFPEATTQTSLGLQVINELNRRNIFRLNIFSPSEG